MSTENKKEIVKPFEDIIKNFSIMEETKDYEIAEYERHQKEIEKKKRYEIYKNSGVPEKFFNASFDTFVVLNDEEKSIKNSVMNFAKNPANKVLILCGNNGTGKTHLGCSIIRAYGGKYITASKLCLKFECANGYKSDLSKEEIIDVYSKEYLLVIDECCKYFLDQELEKFILLQIVCGRYENNKPTVLITNSDKKAFLTFMGKAVFDRLIEVCTTIDFQFTSKRKK